MRHEKKENRGRPSEKPAVVVRKFTREYDDSIWHYDLDKTDKGPYLVEFTDPTYDKLEKLYEKLERLNKPKYHENGRKKRTTNNYLNFVLLDHSISKQSYGWFFFF